MGALGLNLMLTGIVVGPIGALAASLAVSSLLYGISPNDAISFASVALLLTTTAGIVSYLPARRATKVDPIVALRHD